VPGSQAERLGLEPLDVVVAFDGTAIANDDAFCTARHAAARAEEEGTRAPGPARIRVRRGGDEREYDVEPGPLGVVLGRGSPGEAHLLGYGLDREKREPARLRHGDLDRFGALPPLPGTRDDVRAIAEAFAGAAGRARILLGRDATEANVFEHARRARILHLATHGLFDEVWGQSQSAVARTLPARPTPIDDGFLRLSDLLSTWRGRLASCRMVVLSACQTQIGVEQRDEAPEALSIGFLFAGASSVVASLWRVDDSSTAELMADFYRAFAAAGPDADRLVALTAAKKRLKERHPDPFHWAPFVYVGSPR
jgi:CHAT domain-containing protein